MHTPYEGATHLSEHGEALLQTLESGKENAGNLKFAASLAPWYAVQTYPRHEKRVHEDLGSRTIESFLPLYETVNRWRNGCKVRVELPLFPGYVFVRIDPRERFKVLSLPGAISIVGSASGPWPLLDTEIALIRDILAARNFQPHPYLAVGQKVRIKSGALAGLTGFLVRQAGGLRLVLSVELIQQAAAVEVDVNDVGPIGPVPTRCDA